MWCTQAERREDMVQLLMQRGYDTVLDLTEEEQDQRYGAYLMWFGVREWHACGCELVLLCVHGIVACAWYCCVCM